MDTQREDGNAFSVIMQPRGRCGFVAIKVSRQRNRQRMTTQFYALAAIDLDMCMRLQAGGVITFRTGLLTEPDYNISHSPLAHSACENALDRTTLSGTHFFESDEYPMCASPTPGILSLFCTRSQILESRHPKVSSVKMASPFCPAPSRERAALPPAKDVQ
eukprot:1195257-Prorocentrum_minimum.AAC.7